MIMDTRLIHELTTLLDEHLERYQALVDYLAEEKKLLLALDLEGLWASSKRKEELGLDIQAHIKELEAAISETALALSLPPDPPPLLADLAARLPQPWRDRLSEGSRHLARLKNIILRENEASEAFIAESLRLINESIDILTGASQLRGEGYSSGGGQGEKRPSLPVKLSREV
jgi:predicted DNA-binding protein